MDCRKKFPDVDRAPHSHEARIIPASTEQLDAERKCLLRRVEVRAPCRPPGQEPLALLMGNDVQAGDQIRFEDPETRMSVAEATDCPVPQDCARGLEIGLRRENCEPTDAGHAVMTDSVTPVMVQEDRNGLFVQIGRTREAYEDEVRRARKGRH